MRASLRHLGRILASACLFTLLGVGGIAYAWIARPFLFLLPGGQPRRTRITRRVIHRFFQFMAWALQAADILRLEVRDLDPIRDNRGLLLANHPSFLDVVILMALIPDTTCIVKPGVWNNPFFGGVVRCAGFLPAQTQEEVVEVACQALARGETLIIFPEGTRTDLREPLHFRRGAAHIALRSGALILPVRIDTDPPVLAKGDRWCDMPHTASRFRLQGLEPFRSPVADDLPTSLAARKLTRRLESLFA